MLLKQSSKNKKQQNKNMKILFTNFSIKWDIFKFELPLVLQKYLNVLLFIAVSITLILDIVNLCQHLADHLSILTVGDSSLLMSSGTGSGAGTGAGTGTNLPGNSGNPGSVITNQYSYPLLRDSLRRPMAAKAAMANGNWAMDQLGQLGQLQLLF